MGKELVKAVYGGRAPSFVGYSFVGVAGMAKMSSSRGGVPTAADALKVLDLAMRRPGRAAAHGGCRQSIDSATGGRPP